MYKVRKKFNKMARKYLNNLKNYTSLTEKDWGEDPRIEQWEKEKKEFGFDSRETWSLDTTMIELLYERLHMYLEKADPVIVIREPVRQAIEEILHLASIALDEEGDEEVSMEAADKLWKLWSENHRFMWW